MSARPGDLLAHPVALAALALMAVNDHVLKGHGPGWLTGILSDFAGLVVLPVTLIAAVELARGRTVGRHGVLAAIGTATLGYTLAEVWPPATAAWCFAWGVLQWPARALLAAAAGAPIPDVAAVHAWSDPWDLLAIPAVAGAWWAAGPRTRTPSP